MLYSVERFHGLHLDGLVMFSFYPNNYFSLFLSFATRTIGFYLLHVSNVELILGSFTRNYIAKRKNPWKSISAVACVRLCHVEKPAAPHSAV